jgi:hypothetical protein
MRFVVVFAALLTVAGGVVSVLTDEPAYVVMLGLIAVASIVALTDSAVRIPSVLVRVAILVWPAIYFASRFLRRIEDEVLATALQPFAEQVAVPELRRMAVGLNVVRYIVRLGLLWLIVWLVAPDLFVSTRSGLATLFQVLPAVIVAIFVLVVGSAYGIVQQLTSSFGLRAALALTEDERLRSNVIRPLILAAASILISAQVPDQGSPSDALTAAAETLALASVWVLLTAARGLVVIAGEYSGPTNFVLRVVAPVRSDLLAGLVDAVGFKVALLGEALKMGLRRRDSVTVQSALNGMYAITAAYVEAVQTNPLARIHTPSDGVPRVGWLGPDLATALTRAADDALVSGASGDDVDAIILWHEQMTEVPLKAGLVPESLALIDGLIASGTTMHQVTPAFQNIQAKPAGCLARLELVAESNAWKQEGPIAGGGTSLASHALAGFILLATYFWTQFCDPEKEPPPQHPLWRSGIRSLGANPPWNEAARLMNSSAWQTHWTHKLRYGLGPLILHWNLAIDWHSELVLMGRPT